MTGHGRIGMVSPRYPPAIGGVENHVKELVQGLHQTGWSVEVVTTDPTGQSPRAARRDGIAVRRFPTLRGDAVFYLSPRLAWWLIRHARRYDLIHAHSYHTPLALVAALAARLHRRPFVVTPHYHGTGHTVMRSRLHRPYRALGRWMIRQAMLVICCSEAECALIHRDFGEDVTTIVIPHGVDVDRFAGALSFDDLPGTTALTGGRLESYKQVDLVIRAMDALPSDVHLYVFGSGPARGDLEALAGAGRASDRIRFLGAVDDADMPRWFKSAQIFVSLSREEAYGLTAIEGAAAGAAVVLSDIPAYREMVDRLAGFAVSLVSVDAAVPEVAAAIRAAVGAPSASPGAHSELPTWADMVEQVAVEYRRIFLEPAQPDTLGARADA